MNFSRFEFSLLRVSRFYIVFQDMFGEESVPKIFSGDRITVSVDTRKAVIDLASLEVRYIYPFSRKPSYHLSIRNPGELHRGFHLPADCPDCCE